MIDNVSFYDQFELLDLVRDDGVKSFRARELATGRMVEVHVFANSLAPISRALLHKLDKLASADSAAGPAGQSAPAILDRGDYEGTPYVVTLPLDGFSSLHEWVFAISNRTPADPGDPDRLRLSGAGAWRVTPPGGSPVPPPIPVAEPAPEPLLAGLSESDELIPTREATLRPTLRPPAVPEAVAPNSASELPAEVPGAEMPAAEPRLEPVAAAPARGGVALGEFALASEPDEDEFARLFGAAPAPSA